jgi:protocatechuate 3,4-dioxygenase beta subunit
VRQKLGFDRRKFVQGSVGFALVGEFQRAGRALALGSGTPVCNTGTSEQEVGPYYLANDLVRKDLREGKLGLPLQLKLAVLEVRTCKALRNTAVDLWLCDALGLYAGFTRMDGMGMGPGGPPPGDDPRHSGPPPDRDPQEQHDGQGPPEGMGPPPQMHTTDQSTFLRGIQFTDEQGKVEFATVFPGCYMGRTNHIHFKVRAGGRVIRREENSDGKTYVEGHTSHIGQVFFPEAFAAELMRQEPYAKHHIHRTTQIEDDVFQDQQGAASIATLRAIDAKHPAAGYVAELIVTVDPTQTPDPVGMRGPGRSRF